MTPCYFLIVKIKFQCTKRSKVSDKFSLDISTEAFWWIFTIMQGLSIVLIIQLCLQVPDINSATLTELKGLAPDGSQVTEVPVVVSSMPSAASTSSSSSLMTDTNSVQAKHDESEVETEPPAIEEQGDAKAPSNERRLMKSVSMMSSLTEVCKSVKAENATNCAWAKTNVSIFSLKFTCIYYHIPGYE